MLSKADLKLPKLLTEAHRVRARQILTQVKRNELHEGLAGAWPKRLNCKRRRGGLDHSCRANRPGQFARSSYGSRVFGPRAAASAQLSDCLRKPTRSVYTLCIRRLFLSWTLGRGESPGCQRKEEYDCDRGYLLKWI